MAKPYKRSSPPRPDSSPSPQKRKPAPVWKYLLAALGTALILTATHFLWQDEETPNALIALDLGGTIGEEPTLTAANPRLTLLSAQQTGVDFQNTILEDSAHNIILNLNIYNGGGVAVADFNQDQLPDLYFVCSNGKNRLYLNQGNFKFKDVTDQAGVGSEAGFETSATAVDINADGWMDLFVCRAGTDAQDRVAQLFVNNGGISSGGTPAFTERAAEYGLNDRGPCSGANFFDYDNDGDLDCYLINHPTNLGFANKIALKFGPDGKTTVPDLDPKVEHDEDHLYRNDNGKFKLVSKEAGIQNFGFGLSVSVTDINADGWPDIYVGNDFVQPDNFFINNKKGGFTDKIDDYLKHTSMSAMGADLSDFDNDARVDIMTVDMFPAVNERQKMLNNTNSLSRYLTFIKNGYLRPVTRNVLQRNNGNGTFSDVACLAGVFKTDWSWSCLMTDLDNDGLKDIHISNGYRRDLTHHDYVDFIVPEINKTRRANRTNLLPYIDKMPEYKVRNFVFQNKGNWQFEDKSGDWMTMPASWSNGAAWADLDADGDLDLVVNNLEQAAFIYKNQTREQNGGHYIQAVLKGNTKNPMAVGASVLIEYQGIKQYQELNPNHGIFSSVEHLIHFGLGQATQIDRFTVRWPDGKTQTLTNVPANQRLSLDWKNARGYVAHLAPPQRASKPIFTEKDARKAGLDFQHQENPFLDFETWLLNPWTLTDLGPLTAQGDVNGDGLEDFFVGNAFEKAGAVFIQLTNGSFKTSSVTAFQADRRYEDHGGLFFDADMDGDQDLFVLSGGADAIILDLAFQCRLYLNDGKGNFSKSEQAMPPFKDLGLRAVAHDYDKDGDLDLFIGGRCVARKWPETPRSVILQNNGGRFTDVTEQMGGDFERCGMVTDLAFADLDKDGTAELVVVGEWMAITVFDMKQGKWMKSATIKGFEQSNGLWNRLVVADLDGDGDLDLVTGNLGLNTRFKASKEAPFLCFAKDFDQNGTIDPIVAYYESGKIYPLMQKEVLVRQIPVLKKKFLYTKEYAKATIQDVWSQKELDSGLTLKAYDLETCWWENQGGNFVRRALPTQAQSAPAQGILCYDFNQDGHLDILMAGNREGFEVETNPCDAGTGTLLLGDGLGHFSWLDNMQSGFWAMGEARDLAMLRGPQGKKLILVANNNGRLQLYQ